MDELCSSGKDKKMSDDKKPSDSTKADSTKKDDTKPDSVKPDITKKENTKPENTKPDSTKKQPFVPLNKQSKHKQNEYHASKRGTWGNLNPATRKPPNPKAYNRRKTGR